MSTSVNTGDSLSVTVVPLTNHSAVAAMVKSFMNKLEKHGNSVIGLEAEWTSYFNNFEKMKDQQSRVLFMLLCDQDCCYVVHFDCASSCFISDSFSSLLNFLRHPEFSFVGIGIKENVAKLEREYGLGCKNAVELGPLAAEIYGNPRLNGCGMDKLRGGIHLAKIQKPSILGSRQYECFCIRMRQEYSCQVESAIFNAYAYYRIGDRLFAE